MNQNIEKLNNWYESISQLEKLTYSDVLELLDKYKKEENINTKEEIRESLILGTLYVVYEHLINSYFISFKDNSYDMDDIINSFVETWINTLFSNKVYEVPRFSRFFGINFYSQVVEKLKIPRHKISYYTSLDINSMPEVFIEFCKYMEEDSFDYNKFIQKLAIKLFDINDSNFYTASANLYKIFMDIYNSNLKDYDLINMAFYKAKRLEQILINTAFNYRQQTLDNVVINSQTDAVDKKMDSIQLYENIIIPLFEKVKLTDMEKDLIIHRFGINNSDILTLEKLGKKYGKTANYMGVMESRALNKIRRILEVNNIDLNNSQEFIANVKVNNLVRKNRSRSKKKVS